MTSELHADDRQGADADSILTIQSIDRLRARARHLRQLGYNVFATGIPFDYANNLASNPHARQYNAMEAALLHHCLRQGRRRQLDLPKDERVDEWLRRVRAKLTKITLKDLSKSCEGEKEEKTDSVPTLRAARVFHQLISQPDLAISHAAIISYYYLVWSMYLPSIHEHMLGAISARPHERPSAFVAAETTRALLAFHNALEDTIAALDATITLFSDTLEVTGLRLSNEAGLSILLPKLEDHYVHLAEHADRSLLPISAQPPRAIADWASFSDALAGCSLVVRWHGVVESFNRDAPKITQDIEAFVRAPKRARINPVRQAGEGAAHQVARRVVEVFLQVSRELEEVLGNALEQWRKTGRIRWTPKQLSIGIEALSDVRDILAHNAEGFLRLLTPVRTFLRLVVDRELASAAAGSYESVDLPELAFAAATLGSLGRDWEDPHIVRATHVLMEAFRDEQTIRPGRPFNVLPNGYHVNVIGTEIVRAASRLAENAAFEVPASSLEGLLKHVERASYHVPGKARVCFRRDDATDEREWKLWAGCIGFLASDRLVEALDAQVNRRIFRQFETLRPADNKARLTGTIVSDRHLSTLPGHSSAQAVAQRLRRNVAGCESHGAKVTAVILHGPPGTGKTFFAEALAGSSKVPLVTITPSDILSLGEPLAERRAREVFAALAMLTKAVILFDEFDSLLFSRSARADHRAHSGAGWQIYDFITPGMLPKFAKLYRASRAQRLAIVLATNRLWDLDAAAVRADRFDLRVGIFPPDPWSRFIALATRFPALMQEPAARVVKLLMATRQVSASSLRRLRGECSSLNQVRMQLREGAATRIEDADYTKEIQKFEKDPRGYVANEYRDWASLGELEKEAALSALVDRLRG